MRMRHSGRALVTAALLLAAAALVSCSSGGDTNDTAGGATKAAPGGGAQTVTVTLKDNVFEPKQITVERSAVTFEVKNTGIAIHNMHILSSSVEGKDFSSSAIVNPGATDKFTATFTKSGTIKFQCDFHLPDMVGTITVK